MTNEDMMPVGERVKQARQKKGLDLEELAGRVGCSGEYLQWIEDGQVEPPVALLLPDPHATRSGQAPHGVFRHHSPRSRARRGRLPA